MAQVADRGNQSAGSATKGELVGQAGKSWARLHIQKADKLDADSKNITVWQVNPCITENWQLARILRMTRYVQMQASSNVISMIVGEAPGWVGDAKTNVKTNSHERKYTIRSYKFPD